VIIDLDKKRSGEQQQLVKEYYKGYIPHTWWSWMQTAKPFTTPPERWIPG
jgi:hypothetical protein